MIFPRRRTRKHNVGCPLDLRNPLTRGLRYAADFNEGSGGAVKNHALPLTATTLPTDGTLGSTTNMSWTPRRFGALTYTFNADSYTDFGPNDDTTGEITWIAWVYPSELSRALYTIFGQNKSDGSESIDSVYMTSGGNLSWWINRTGGQTEVLNGTASSLTANAMNRLAGRRSGAAGAWQYDQWINERLNDTAASALDPTVNASDGNFRVGMAGLYTAAPFVGDFTLFLFWHGVALKDADLLSLSANPWQLWTPLPRRLWVAGAGGLQTQDVGGSSTAAGSLSNSVILPRTGSVTSAGAAANQIQNLLTGSLTGAGSILRQFGRPLAGSSTPAGNSVAQGNQTLSGSSAPTGTKTEAVTAAPFAGTVQPAGAVAELVQLTLSGGSTAVGNADNVGVKVQSLDGSVDPTGSAVELVQLSRGGSTTPTGTSSRVSGIGVSGTVTTAGTTTEAVTKAVAGSAQPTGTATSFGVKLQSLDAEVGATGAVVEQVQKAVSGNTTAAGVVTRTASHPVSGTATAVGTATETIVKAVGGSSTPSGTSTNARTVLQEFSGGVAAAGGVVKSVLAAFLGSMTGGGGLERAVAKIIAGLMRATGLLDLESTVPTMEPATSGYVVRPQAGTQGRVFHVPAGTQGRVWRLEDA